MDGLVNASFLIWSGVIIDGWLLQVIINFNALPWLLNLLSSSKKGIRKEACWTISNITAGNKEQIQAVIEANIIPPLIELLSNAEFDIRKVHFTFRFHHLREERRGCCGRLYLVYNI